MQSGQKGKAEESLGDLNIIIIMVDGEVPNTFRSVPLEIVNYQLKGCVNLSIN